LKQFPLCALVSGALALVTQLVAADALAQGVKDQLGTVTKKPDEEGRPAWMKKMAGSSVDLSSYVGSGSFYATKWSDPYVSMAIFVRPTYDLGTRFKLSANARLYVEEELTMPDVPNGRRFSPYDIWLWLSAKDLYTFSGPKIRLGGVARVVVPISYESRYAHMVTGMAGGLSLSRPFEFGSAPTAEGRWNLVAVVSSVFTKYLYTSDLRGDPPGDSTGCRPFLPGGLAAGSAGGPTASEGDRCGGPVNTNFALTSSGTLSLTHGKWNLAVILLIANSFRYRVAENVSANLPESAIGRSDTTWGIVSLTYSFTDHLGISVGLSSYQPALDSQYRRLRFPFFDTNISGSAVANIYTQAFVSLSGTL
jgi:hypothetical protein